MGRYSPNIIGNYLNALARHNADGEAVVGGRKPEHFEPLYECCDIELDEADVQHIDDISDWAKYQPFVNQPIVRGPELALNRW